MESDSYEKTPQDFFTSDSVDAFLGNLLREVDRRDAATLAYGSQRWLNSHVALGRHIETATETQSRIVAQRNISADEDAAPAGQSRN
jgi:hypothetical protein